MLWLIDGGGMAGDDTTQGQWQQSSVVELNSIGLVSISPNLEKNCLNVSKSISNDLGFEEFHLRRRRSCCTQPFFLIFSKIFSLSLTISPPTRASMANHSHLGSLSLIWTYSDLSHFSIFDLDGEIGFLLFGFAWVCKFGLRRVRTLGLLKVFWIKSLCL